MTDPDRLPRTLAPLLDGLARSLASCDPEDSHETTALLRNLDALHQELEHDETRHLAELAAVAHRLVDRLASHGLVGPRETLEVVGKALAAVRSGLGLEEPALPAIAEAEQPVQLSLLDGKRIGELLITLSMLEPVDVERALVKQRATGMLLGEALVELQILSPGAVDAALRLQSSRRRRDRAGDDTWALPG